MRADAGRGRARRSARGRRTRRDDAGLGEPALAPRLTWLDDSPIRAVDAEVFAPTGLRYTAIDTSAFFGVPATIGVVHGAHGDRAADRHRSGLRPNDRQRLENRSRGGVLRPSLAAWSARRLATTDRARRRRSLARGPHALPRDARPGTGTGVPRGVRRRAQHDRRSPTFPARHRGSSSSRSCAGLSRAGHLRLRGRRHLARRRGARVEGRPGGYTSALRARCLRRRSISRRRAALPGVLRGGPRRCTADVRRPQSAPAPVPVSTLSSRQTIMVGTWVYGDEPPGVRRPRRAVPRSVPLLPGRRGYRSPLEGRCSLRSPELQASASRAVRRRTGFAAVRLPKPEPAPESLDALDRRTPVDPRRTRRAAPARAALDAAPCELRRHRRARAAAVPRRSVRWCALPTGAVRRRAARRAARARALPFRPAPRRARTLRSLGCDELAGLTPYDELLVPSAAVAMISAVFWRSRFKYGSRAYRFALLEAGHVAQNYPARRDGARALRLSCRRASTTEGSTRSSGSTGCTRRRCTSCLSGAMRIVTSRAARMVVGDGRAGGRGRAADRPVARPCRRWRCRSGSARARFCSSRSRAVASRLRRSRRCRASGSPRAPSSCRSSPRTRRLSGAPSCLAFS